jgi:tRNA A-37 threonylcarbamoyl transferase component Bud32/DNA-binding beta-propeller fold protein YncE
VTDQRIGTEVAGYQIEGVVGRGGMSVVYLAEDPGLKRKIALKVLSPELAEDQRFRDRFIRESQLAASLEHPNIVPIHEAGEADGVLFIAMRYVRGTDLKTLIARDGPLDPERAVAIVAQVAAALDAAHAEGLIHRDVKPSNVLVAEPDRSGAEHAYLTDFGLIRRVTHATSLTKTGQFMGTIDYVAPEQVRGDQMDARADVYSLGCLLYECLTGEPPFPSDLEVTVLYAHLEEPPPKLTARRPELPAALDDVVAKAMAKRPEDRYGSAGELASAARAALAPHPVPPGETPAPPGRRRTRMLAGVAAALIVVAAVVLGFGLSRHHQSAAPPPGTHSGGGSPKGQLPRALLEVNPASGHVLHEVPIPVIAANTQLHDLAIGEGGVWALSARGIGEPLLHVDERSGTVRATIPSRFEIGVGAQIVAGYQSVWVPAKDGLQVVDPATDRTVDQITFGSHDSPSALSLGAGSVWVAFEDGTLIRLDPGTHRTLSEIHLPGGIDDVVVDRSGTVWALDRLDNTVVRVDPRTSRVASVHIAGDLGVMAVGYGTVWVLESSSGAVVPVDRTDLSVGSPIRVGKAPFDVAVGLGAVWVTDLDDGNIYRIDPATRTASSIHVGRRLGAIAVDERADTLWIDTLSGPTGTTG